MFGRIGTGELILILVVALIVVGPSKLPEMGKTFGKTLNEFKKFSNDIKADLSLDSTAKKTEKVEKIEKIEESAIENAENENAEKGEII